MTFKTLENISTDELLEVFNDSFSDYLVPFKLTKEQLESKLNSENIKPDLSTGAFENNRCIGFILHGYDIIKGTATAYNGGTGVIPGNRGNNLTAKMYEYIIPILQQQGIKKIQFEVITGNKPAIKVYEKIGFKIIRGLHCYKGFVSSKEVPTNFTIQDVKEYKWEKFQLFWNWAPSWQNSITAVEKIKQSNIAKGIYNNDAIIGYIIYNPITKRVQQFAVDKNYRNKGAGRLLFESIAKINNNEITLINVDGNPEETKAFLNKLGLKVFIEQYEMEFDL